MNKLRYKISSYYINILKLSLYCFFNLFVFEYPLIADNENPSLAQYSSNIFSQFGEDGIIEKIFEIIGVNSAKCIEIINQDRFYQSNTANLSANQKWNAILVLTDVKKHHYDKNILDLFNPDSIFQITHNDTKVNINQIESLLLNKGIYISDIDLLSINENTVNHLIFENMSRLKPRVIICKYNTALPPKEDNCPDCKNPLITQSPSTLKNIANNNNYELISIGYHHCFFVTISEFEKFKGYETHFENICVDRYIDQNGFWVGQAVDQEHVYDDQLANAIANFLLKENTSTVVDFGCGMGDYARLFSNYGIITEAYDGNPATPELTGGLGQIQDLSIPFYLKKTYEWVISLEVAEHLPKQFEKIFVENLIRHCQKGIILSWAIKGQGGYGHFNCQDNDYVKKLFKKYGLINDIKAEKLLRKNSTMPWFKKTVMVFRKTGNNKLLIDNL